MPLSRYLKYLDTLLAAIAGFCLIYLFTKYSGIGISPDSIMYTSAANSFSHNGTLITFKNAPIVDFPLFYPVFLGVIKFFTHVDFIKSGFIINGTLFATVICLSSWIMLKFEHNSWLYKCIILLCIVLSPALIEVYTYMWSETLFLLLILIFFIALREYLLKHTIKTLVILAIIGGVSCITRYVGVTLIGTAGLLMLFDRNLSIKKRINHILIFGVVASILLVLNLVRNGVLTGTSTGPREASVTPFSKNIYYFGEVLLDWLGFTEKTYSYATPLAILIILGLVAGLIYNLIKRKNDHFETIAIAFTLVYGLFIIVSATFSRYERINTRLLSPLFISLLWGCTSWATTYLRHIKLSISITAVFVFTIIMYVFAYGETDADLQRWDDQNDYGNPGYTDDTWNKSPIAGYLEKNQHIFKPGIPIYSDANEAVYLFGGITSNLLPHLYFKKDIDKFYQIKRFYLVWFPGLYNPELIDLHDVLKHKKLTTIKEFPDGTIYLCDENK